MTVCWTGSRMTGSSKLRSFEDLTVGEKRFFCLWNQFKLDRGYIGSVSRVHMTSMLDRFLEEIGREVMEGKLYTGGIEVEFFRTTRTTPYFARQPISVFRTTLYFARHLKSHDTLVRTTRT